MTRTGVGLAALLVLCALASDPKAANRPVRPSPEPPPSLTNEGCLPDGRGMLVRTDLDAFGGFYDSPHLVGDALVFEEYTGEEPHGTRIAIHDVDTGVTRRLPYGGSVLEGDGDVFVTSQWMDDRHVLRWHRVSVPFSSEPFVGERVSVRRHWIAYVVPENYSGDRNGDLDTYDDFLHLIDTRDGSVLDTGLEVSFPRMGDREVFFVAYERVTGSDRNGDGDDADSVLSWYALPGEGMEAGVQYSSGDLLFGQFAVEGDTAIFLSGEQDSGQDLNGDGVVGSGGSVRAVWAPGATVFNTGGKTPWRWERSRYAVDGSKFAFTTPDGTAAIFDFVSGETTSLGFLGEPWTLQGRHLQYWRHERGPHVRPLDFLGFDLRTGRHTVLATDFDHEFFAHSARGDVVSWRRPAPPELHCPGAPNEWMEYHRLSTGRSANTAILGRPLVGNDRYIATVLHEWEYNRDLDPGAGGSRHSLLAFYFYPCENFEDLDVHLRRAASDGPGARQAMRRLAGRARRLHRHGRPALAEELLCELSNRIGSDPDFASPSREIVQACVRSTAIQLGIAPEDGFCGQVDSCPGLPNPMGDDADGDGVGTACDNCPFHHNLDQTDTDADAFGDACDNCSHFADPALGMATGFQYDCRSGFEDRGDEYSNLVWADCDDDGLGQACDNCWYHDNPHQADADGDQVGDACDNCPGVPGGIDYDGDADGVPQCIDTCRRVADPAQADGDADGIGDACDNCGSVANADQSDLDSDDAGDVCDPDDDDDGLPDGDDPCPLDRDRDHDGVCSDVDRCDYAWDPEQTDADGDGIGDACDNCPLVATLDQADKDYDRLGDACDDCRTDPGTDADGDGLCPTWDNCDLDFNPDQASRDGDAFGDPCDACPDTFDEEPVDFEQDGVWNSCDNCFFVSNPDQADGDGDGTGDYCDSTP